MKKKIILIVLGILLLAGIGVGVYWFVNRDKEDEGPKNKAAIVDRIDGYDYTLDDRDTKIFKDEFQNLKTILTGDEIDYDAYAESLAKLFVIDFYTLSTKINKYDVGCLEYLKDTDTETFKSKAGDTLYKYVEDDTNHKRVQTLPEVKSIVDTDLSTEGDTYSVTIEWDYQKDLEYDNKAVIKFIKIDNKLYLEDYSPETEENQD